MSKTKKITGVAIVFLMAAWILVIPLIGMKGFATRLHQEREVEAVFLADSEEELVLLFWGYVGCYTACPVSLSVLSDVYNSYTGEYPGHSLNVSFVGLPLPGEQNTQKAVQRYAQKFNRNFKGYSLSGEALGGSLREFDVSFSPSTFSPKDLNHSAFVYLLQKCGGALDITAHLHPVSTPGRYYSERFAHL